MNCSSLEKSSPLGFKVTNTIRAQRESATSVYMLVVTMTCSAVVILVLLGLWRAVRCTWWRPLMLKRAMRRQGLRGPSPLFMIGNFAEIMKLEEAELASDMGSFGHDILQRMLPHYTKWAKLYGKRFVFWEASEPRIVVTEPELIREVCSAKWALAYGKSYIHQRCCEHFLGRGVAMANGEAWARQRRVIVPAFHIDKLKGLAGMMRKCTEQLISKWGDMVSGQQELSEIEVEKDLRRLTADIIACTEFGSSYEKGKRIFELLTTLQKLTLQFAHFVWLPGSRFLPTSWNWDIRRLQKEMEQLLREIIQERIDLMRAGKIQCFGNDLLGLMLQASQERACDEGGDNIPDDQNSLTQHHGHEICYEPKFTIQQIMDECKTFFFAGHETTAGLLTWSMLLLAANPEWQERARDEVFNVCGENGDPVPEAETLRKLKILGMVINETLRLYPPVIVITKYALMDMTLGDMNIPKGSSVLIPVLAMHLDRELWGEDVHHFKPQRFEQGVARACKHPLAYMPFAFGPRNCVGQSFALMEAKIVLSMILRSYRFTLAPSYKHAPIAMLTLKPKHGAQVILERLL